MILNQNEILVINKQNFNKPVLYLGFLTFKSKKNNNIELSIDLIYYQFEIKENYWVFTKRNTKESKELKEEYDDLLEWKNIYDKN